MTNLRSVAFTSEELDAAAQAIPASESGYRRGYCHGYSQAMDDMRELMRRRGYSRSTEAWNILARFYDRVLSPWRRNRREGSCCPPSARLTMPDSWAAVRERVFRRDGYRCVRCGSEQQLECDHVLEVRCGGCPDDDNLRTLCRPCHIKRRAQGASA